MDGAVWQIPKIGEHQFVVLSDKQVLQLEVAMRQFDVVHVQQSLQCRLEHATRRVFLQRSISFQQLGETALRLIVGDQ